MRVYPSALVWAGECKRGAIMTNQEPAQNEHDEHKELTQELTDGYTASQATRILSEKAGRPVFHDYVRTLARQKKIRAIKVNSRLTLYNKDDVKNYVVEERGTKAGRAAIERSTAKKKATARRSGPTRKTTNKPKLTEPE